MTSILIAYDTTEGQTRTIAEHIADVITGSANEVQVIDIRRPPTGFTPDAFDAVVRGYFKVDAKDSGDFQFGYVQGQIDYQLGERDGKPAVEFTWDGNDEADAAQWRGWLVLDGDELQGMLYIHHGDKSRIMLKREPEKKPRKRK